jgi:hypothetical protein
MDLSTPLPDAEEPTPLQDLQKELDFLFMEQHSDLELLSYAVSTPIIALPTASTATHTDEAENRCGICYEELFCLESEAIKLTTCGHTFHRHCLVGALECRSKDRCPYCRREVVGKGRKLSRSDLRVGTEVIEGLVEYLGLRDRQMRAADAQQVVTRAEEHGEDQIVSVDAWTRR